MLRFFSQWKRIEGGAYSFSPLVLWYCPNLFGWRHSIGIAICNFAMEFYWSKA